MSEIMKVLHVDDDEDIRTITKLAFSLDSTFELTQCSCGGAAVEIAQEMKPDLLLLDMIMPGMNGEETWEKMKSEVGLTDTPTIFMSARAEQQFASDLIKKGATGIITKPFDPMSLCQQIRDKLSSAAAPVGSNVTAFSA